MLPCVYHQKAKTSSHSMFMQPQREGGDTAPTNSQSSTRIGDKWSVQGKEPAPTEQEVVWALWPVWMGTQNLAPTGIRSLDHPAYSKLTTLS
jgi:hypothetical protein